MFDQKWELLRAHLGEVAILEFAAASGVSERMLRYLRGGSRRPSPDTAQAVLGALGEVLDD